MKSVRNRTYGSVDQAGIDIGILVAHLADARVIVALGGTSRSLASLSLSACAVARPQRPRGTPCHDRGRGERRSNRGA
jgi:hypothetical protein